MVDIGIVTWNRFALTRRCIASLLRYTDSPFRLFAADNGSTDGTRDYLIELYKQDIIHRLLLFDANVGVAPASNSLWELSDSTLFLKMDNDIEIKRSGWLAEMAGVARRNPEVGLLAFSFRKQLYNKEYPFVTLSSGDVVQAPDETLGGACIMITRKTHWDLGFWCEDYAPYGEEDAEYCQRAMMHGIKMYYVRDTDWMIHNKCQADGHHDPVQYREFKQAHRASNTSPTGLCSINMLMYNLNLRPLAMRRKFKTILADDGVSARLELNRDYLRQEGKQVAKFKKFLKHNADFMRTS